jgi:diaminopimelate epimerase
MRFHKYHGLGNDYLVIDPKDLDRDLTSAEIRLICNRNYGAGSDGILIGPIATDAADCKVRIFNPDGSEAEKSGNGLRIFSRYLFDKGLVGTEPFTILTLGGTVRSQVYPDTKMVRVQMGQVTFDAAKIPVAGDPREVIGEHIRIGGREFTFSAASIGNPHCVVVLDEISEVLARTYGPLIETDPRFPNRTNVQFLKVIDQRNIQIEIWERGAGYTLASGSSSSAAAAVAHKLGLCGREITVHMPGGTLEIAIGDGFAIDMIGPVTAVYAGNILEEAFSVTPAGT